MLEASALHLPEQDPTPLIIPPALQDYGEKSEHGINCMIKQGLLPGFRCGCP
jgi:hypothetical protein